LYNYFPNSLDRAAPDRGVFNDGVKPIIFSALQDSSQFMMMLLNTKKKRNNGNNNGRIDFGAHQAIIVRNETSIEDLPEDLKIHPHIYTVAQSKGLEFKDVLLYLFY
jgi:hypothetical protein